MTLALGVAGCQARPPAPLHLRCTTAYGGEEHVHDIAPTHAPYRVEPTAVGKRFLFEATYVDAPAEVERVHISVFTQDDPPKILQDVTYRPPYPRADPGARYGFTGLTHVYTDTARELTYSCSFGAASAKVEPAAVQATPPRTDHPHARIVMTGDISLDDGPGRVIATGEDPFTPCAPWLAHADLTVGNLECSVARGGEALEKEFTFRADPATMAVLAKHLGAVSLANNHSGDFGPGALVETFGALRAANVPFFGAGMNLEQAHAPLVVTRGGLKIAFLGYDDYRPRWYEAGATRPGVAWNAEEQVLADIRLAKRQGADIVIPFLHWGWENEGTPWVQQRERAQGMLDAGATLVVGAHPHVTQGVELYAGKPVVFSLGNFVFSLLDNDRQSQAWILRLELDEQGVARWDTVSVEIDERGVPRPKPEVASPCGRRGLERVGACAPELDVIARGI